jgi:hypothetical protein
MGAACGKRQDMIEAGASRVWRLPPAIDFLAAKTASPAVPLEYLPGVEPLAPRRPLAGPAAMPASPGGSVGVLIDAPLGIAAAGQ